MPPFGEIAIASGLRAQRDRRTDRSGGQIDLAYRAGLLIGHVGERVACLGNARKKTQQGNAQRQRREGACSKRSPHLVGIGRNGLTGTETGVCD